MPDKEEISVASEALEAALSRHDHNAERGFRWAINALFVVFMVGGGWWMTKVWSRLDDNQKFMIESHRTLQDALQTEIRQQTALTRSLYEQNALRIAALERENAAHRASAMTINEWNKERNLLEARILSVEMARAGFEAKMAAVSDAIRRFEETLKEAVKSERVHNPNRN
jgi:hypothetical protein